MNASSPSPLVTGLAVTLLLAGLSATPTVAAPPQNNLVLQVDDDAPTAGDGSGRSPFRNIANAVNAARSAAALYARVAINVAPGRYPVDDTLRIDFPVEIRGSNVPDLDLQQWPLGTVQAGTATTVEGTADLGSKPLLLVGGASGAVVTGITIRNLTLRSNLKPGTPPTPGSVMQVQRAQDFVVANNIVKAPGFSGIDVAASSGTITQNHVSGMQICGICVGAGTAASPATVTLQDNRSVGNSAGGLLLGGSAFPVDEIGDTLNATVTHNDLSSHTGAALGFGLRVIALGQSVPGAQSGGNVTAQINDNRIVGNRRGLMIDAGFPQRYSAPGICDAREFTGRLNLSLRGNTVTGSLSRSALVSFTRGQAITVGTGPAAPSLWRYLHRAAFAITDPDLSIAGYLLDDPDTDPNADPACTADTAVTLLQNSFTYNGNGG